MKKSNNSLGERASNKNKLSVGVGRASEYEYKVVKQNHVEQLRKTLHLATQGSKLVSRGALLLVDLLAELLEFIVRRLNGSELLTRGDLEIVCRDAFARNRKIDYLGRNIN